MSCYEWEYGEIKLPTGEAAKFKKALRDASNEMHAETLRICQSWWKINKTTSQKIYNSRVNKLWNPASGREPMLANQIAIEVLSDCGGTDTQRPHMARAADVDRVISRSNVRTTQWELHLADAVINIEDNTVSWSVDENNHAREHAHNHPLATILFSMLDRVSWTKGSGGQISGNDEYNQDDRGMGGGGNYVIATYGAASKSRRLITSYR